MKTRSIDSTDCLVLFADLQLGIIELTRTLPIGNGGRLKRTDTDAT